MNNTTPGHSTEDLRSFFDTAASAGLSLHITKPVDVRNQVASLCSHTMQPTLFENLKGFEGFRLADCLSRTRTTQALTLGIENRPETVIPTYLQRLSKQRSALFAGGL